MLGTDQQPDLQRSGPGSGGVTGRGWLPGRSGNAKGRPPAPVDIAALCRQYGPRCVEVAAALLDDPDPRIRLAALVALLDRGYGRPAQTIQAADNINSFGFQHLVAARESLVQINREREEQERQLREPLVINGEATKAPDAAVSTPVNLFEPALE